MKKVLYFVLFALTAVLCGCNKDDEDVYEAEPAYKSWTRSNFIYDNDLKGNGWGFYFYYNSDSVVVDHKSTYVTSKNDTIRSNNVYKLSTHNFVFSSYKMPLSTDAQMIAFAEKWSEEIKKESNRYDWCLALGSYIDAKKISKYKDLDDYGLLWGLKPDRISEIGIVLNILHYQFEFGGYTLDYIYDGGPVKARTESVTLKKSSTILKTITW